MTTSVPRLFALPRLLVLVQDGKALAFRRGSTDDSHSFRFLGQVTASSKVSENHHRIILEEPPLPTATTTTSTLLWNQMAAQPPAISATTQMVA